MLHTLRIVAADDELDMRVFYQELLHHLGHQVILAESGRQLIAECRTHQPNLVITDIRLPDLDGLCATADIVRVREVPVILVTGHHTTDLQERARQGPIMAYLVKPVKPVELEMAIELAVLRFEHYQTLSREAESLRHALEDRKLIERAKGIVMQRIRVAEAEAFALLRGLSSARNRKLAEIAESLVSSDEIYKALERTPTPPAARKRVTGSRRMNATKRKRDYCLSVEEPAAR